MIKNLKMIWDYNPKTKIRVIGHIFFVIYFLLALVFYKERTIFIDCADFSFDLIQSKNFVFPLGRWSSFFTQIIPLFALKLGVSLELFLKTYSLSIALFYYAVYLVIAYSFKNNEKLIAVYLLTICLTVRNTFYFSIAELPQGLALCVIVYGLAKQLTDDDEKRKWIKTALIVAIIASLYYFHQLMLFAIIFALLAIIINKKTYKNKQLIIAFLFTNIWFGFKLLLISSSGYEGEKMPGLDVFVKQIPNLFNLPSFKYFFHFAKIEMWYSLILLLGCLTLLFLRKKILLATFFLIYIISYLLLIIITYYKGEAPNMYELYYVLLGFFIAIILDITIRNLNQKVVFLTFLIVLLFSMNRVYLAHEKPSKRIVFLEKLVEKGKKYEGRKYVINVKDFPWDYAWVTWAVPMETLLISSLKNKEEAVTCFISKDPSRLNLNVENGKILAPAWLRYETNIDALDDKYFSLPQRTPYYLLGKNGAEQVVKDYDYYLKRIAKDEKWMTAIKKKAMKLNITKDSSLAIEARYWATKNGY